jgi:hypothetical protein
VALRHFRSGRTALPPGSRRSNCVSVKELSITGSNQSGTRKRKGIPLWGRIAAALFALGLVWFLCARVWWAMGVSRRLADIRNQGMPATVEELNRWYAYPPAGENAADIFVRAFLLYASPELAGPSAVAEAELTLADLPLSEPLRWEYETILEENADALRLLHKAASMRECRYRVDFSLAGIGVVPPHLEGLRRGMQLLEMEMFVCADERNFLGAQAAVMAAFGLARSVEQEPLMVSWGSEVYLHGRAVSLLQRLINLWPLDDEHLRAFAALIEEGEDAGRLATALIGERCIGSDAFADPYHVLEGVLGLGAVRYRRDVIAYRWMGLRDLDHTIYMDLMEHSIAQAQRPFGEGLTPREAGPEQMPKYCLLSPLLNVPADTFLPGRAQHVATLRAARVALALERYRLANDALPSTLAELTPKYLAVIPEAPFTGKPLLYSKAGLGYSVCPARRDAVNVEPSVPEAKPRMTRGTFAVER